MTRAYWFIAALILSAALALLNFWALDQYLYWKNVWFDIPMHFLGGLTIGVFAAALVYRFRPWFFVLLSTVAFVGWEVFEYLFGIPKEANYVFDTSLDLLMDALGALIVYGVARATLWRRG